MTDQQLRDHITADPNQRGYAAHVASGDHAAIARLLNEVRAGVAIERRTATWLELFKLFVPGEYAGLNAAQLQRLGHVALLSPVPIKEPIVRQILAECFAVGSLTRTALLDYVNRPGSDYEFLAGAGAVAHHLDVARALAAGGN